MSMLAMLIFRAWAPCGAAVKGMVMVFKHFSLGQSIELGEAGTRKGYHFSGK